MASNSSPRQEEIVKVMGKLSTAMHGHSRATNLIALVRMMAVMIAPSNQREEYIAEIPRTMRNILAKMDQLVNGKIQ